MRASNPEQNTFDPAIGRTLMFDFKGMIMPEPFVLTQAESDFIHHHRYEASYLVGGPAGDWLRENGIYSSNMIPFLYADQETNPRWLDRLTEDPFPPFKPAWSSKEEFEARAWAALEAYPQLRSLGSALPGFRPTHVANTNLAPVS
jgi:hypothetical protein